MVRFSIVEAGDFFLVVDRINGVKFKVFGNIQKAIEYLRHLSFHDIVTEWIHIPDKDTYIEVDEF